MSAVDTWLDECRPKLPLQNPLWAFIHNNVLQHFEDQPFHQGLKEAAALYRAQTFESEHFYRAEFARGRISEAALTNVVKKTLRQDAVAEDFLKYPYMGDDEEPLKLHKGPAGQHMIRYSYRDRPLLDILVPLIATYLDQGMCRWKNPFSEEGFWNYFSASILATPNMAYPWVPGLKKSLQNFQGSLEDRIVYEIDKYVEPGHEASYCLQTLFILKGWSGMVHRLETFADLAPRESPNITLKDWLGALLVSVHALEGLDTAQDSKLTERVAPSTLSFGRRRRWQKAYEDTFIHDFLHNLERRQNFERNSASSPKTYQVLVCMDDRMESFRRSLETQPDFETLGGVGFFGIDMSYVGIGAAKPTRQCPPVVEPKKTIHEVAQTKGKQEVFVKLKNSLSLATYYQSRTLIRGFFISFLLGVTSFVPMLLRVLLPGVTRKFLAYIDEKTFRVKTSDLDVSQYSLADQASIVESALAMAGVIDRVAPVFAVVSHGSTTTNNPFKQAYGCGACSGNSGAPNARAFCKMANSPEVRKYLVQKGYVISEATLFVPVYFDTTTSQFEILDAHLIDASKTAQIEKLLTTFKAAAVFDAQERCKRFVEGPFTGESASAHVLMRGHDLAQPRPEIGHNRVAACIVGHRGLTSSLNLDRRSFLVSYDATKDPEGKWLAPVVLGSVPVAVNIMMDYYFSRVDPDGFGCGSKLPLNVVSLLGLVTGSKSDLRIGLARQMVELHEPMRPLILIEASEEMLRKHILSHPRIAQLVQNEWMVLGKIDPVSGHIELLVNDQFVPWKQALGLLPSGKYEPTQLTFDPKKDRVAFA